MGAIQAVREHYKKDKAAAAEFRLKAESTLDFAQLSKAPLKTLSIDNQRELAEALGVCMIQREEIKTFEEQLAEQEALEGHDELAALLRGDTPAGGTRASKKGKQPIRGKSKTVATDPQPPEPPQPPQVTPEEAASASTFEQYLGYSRVLGPAEVLQHLRTRGMHMLGLSESTFNMARPGLIRRTAQSLFPTPFPEDPDMAGKPILPEIPCYFKIEEIFMNDEELKAYHARMAAVAG